MVGTIILSVLWCVAGWAFNWTIAKLQKRVVVLEKENLTLAKSIQRLAGRISELEEPKELTSDPEPPKIVAKRTIPRHVNWKQARQAYEQASASEETE